MELSLQKLYNSKIAGNINRGIAKLSDARLPPIVLKPAILAYKLGLTVDMKGVIEPPGGFATFGDFFARKLAKWARPVCADKDAVVIPSDGELTSFGQIDRDSTPHFRIKSSSYDVAAILGSSLGAKDFEEGGGYLVIYLHPRDYHWVHSPVNGELLRVRHIQGARFPVAPWSEKRIGDIFGKNERMVFDIRTEGGSLMSLVMVAAFGVSNIETEYAPQSVGEGVSERQFDSPVPLDRGSDLGVFRLGSTVLLLWQANSVVLEDGLRPGRVLMGQKMGSCALVLC